MLPLEIILTKRSSRNAEAMYKRGRGSEGGGNRNYFNAIKIPQMVLYWQRAMSLFSQTEVEQTRFPQNTRYGLVWFLTYYQVSPSPSPCASLKQLARLARRQLAAGAITHERNAECFGSARLKREKGPSTVSDICNPGCVGVDISV